MKRRASKTIAVLFAGTLLAACNGNVLGSSVPKHEKAVPNYLVKSMKTKGMTLGAPIMMRIFKEENVMEVWKKDHKQQFALLQTYEICKWSGGLGPKFKEGDRQAPEGFYHVTKGLMNPNSSFHLSFNLGFPNTYDRANGRTGSFLMVHGDCSSAGCYSMTDEFIEEIYSMAREAFKGGQKAFQVQAFPFRMTAKNLAKKANHPKFEFWKMLKEGSDHFEVTNKQLKVDVCEKRYVFNRVADEGKKFNAKLQCPPSKTSRSLALAFNAKQSKDQAIFDKILKTAATSPFVKAEDKPKTTNLSIKANPTIGTLAILQPVKPATARVASVPVKEFDTTVDGVNAAAEADSTQAVPIKRPSVQSSTVQTPKVEASTVEIPTVQPKVIVEEVSKIAVPEQAQRIEPQS